MQILKCSAELLDRVPEIINDPEARYELLPRLANSYAQGILQISKERESSLILMGWRGKKTFTQSVLGTILDEVIWGSDSPVMVGKLEHTLLGMRRVLLLLPEGAVSHNALRRILQANLGIAEALNVPLNVLAHKQYFGQINSLLDDVLHEQPVILEEMVGSLRLNDLEKHVESDLLVIPGFGSRQRFLANLGNLPERLADAFKGNLVILHYDR